MTKKEKLAGIATEGATNEQAGESNGSVKSSIISAIDTDPELKEGIDLLLKEMKEKELTALRNLQRFEESCKGLSEEEMKKPYSFGKTRVELGPRYSKLYDDAKSALDTLQSLLSGKKSVKGNLEADKEAIFGLVSREITSANTNLTMAKAQIKTMTLEEIKGEYGHSGQTIEEIIDLYKNSYNIRSKTKVFLEEIFGKSK